MELQSISFSHTHTHTHKTNKDWENENNAFTMQLSDIKEKLKKIMLPPQFPQCSWKIIGGGGVG